MKIEQATPVGVSGASQSNLKFTAAPNREE